MSIQAALDDAQRVVKKQKVCAERVDGCIDQLISLVLAARAELASGPKPRAVKELQKKIQKLGLEKEMNSQTKELHVAVGKLNKVRCTGALRMHGIKLTPSSTSTHMQHLFLSNVCSCRS